MPIAELFTARMRGDTLDLENCNLTDSEIPDVLEFLFHHPHIQHLNLNKNRITDTGAIELATALPILKINERGEVIGELTTVRTLILTNNNLTLLGTKALLDNSSFAKLDIEITPETISELNYMEDIYPFHYHTICLNVARMLGYKFKNKGFCHGLSYMMTLAEQNGFYGIYRFKTTRHP